MSETTEVHCTQCGKRYIAPLNLLGKKIQCKACGSTFVARSSGEEISAFHHDPNSHQNFQPNSESPWDQHDHTLSYGTQAPQTSQSSQSPTEFRPLPASQSNSESLTGANMTYPTDKGNHGRQRPGGSTDQGYWNDPQSGVGDPPVSFSGGGREGTRADVIDYEIFGHETQYVEITLDPGEVAIAEAGAMMYMDSAIQMDTVFGDPSESGGGFWSKALGAGKRMLTGESLFMTTYTNRGSQRAKVAFGSPYPGRMIPLHLDELGGEIVCQKGAFLCGARGIKVDIAFQKKLGAGLLGGEGFIMQRLRGDGVAIAHAGGTMMFRMLAAGEVLRVDTGCLMALGSGVDYDVQFIGGIKNTLFGGEGFVLATLTGPGPVWLQSLPFSRLAGRVAAATPGVGGSNKGEGSLLGGLGDMLMGDNS